MKKTVFRVLFLVHLCLFIAILVLAYPKWNVFYGYALPISAALLVATSSLMRIRQELGDKVGKERRIHCIGKVGAALFVLAANLLLAYFTAERSPSPMGFYQSADGQHELVIIKFAHLGEVYSARPSKHHILYGDQPKDIVFSGFDKPASDIQVRWLDDGSARVYFIYDPAAGPLEQDSILISFAEQ